MAYGLQDKRMKSSDMILKVYNYQNLNSYIVITCHI